MLVLEYFLYYWLFLFYVVLHGIEAIKDIKSPTLILWGEADTWVPIEHGYRFKSDIPNSTLILYEDVGHVPQDEIPEQSARDVKTFLKNSTVK